LHTPPTTRRRDPKGHSSILSYLIRARIVSAGARVSIVRVWANAYFYSAATPIDSLDDVLSYEDGLLAVSEIPIKVPADMKPRLKLWSAKPFLLTRTEPRLAGSSEI
jgi:hypothetical protein